MAPLNEIDLTELTIIELWQWISELMEEGLSDGDVDGFANAAPFRMAKRLLDELVARDPDWNYAEIAEFRTTLERVLAGERGFTTGHA
jgi:hypothetical protein